jgi:D-alanyl-D-alanine-carboxypeptidase/D-alanyl-D-alanine-endopeptidase
MRAAPEARLKTDMIRVPTCVLSSFEPPQVCNGHRLDLFVQIGFLTKTLTATVLTAFAASGPQALDAVVRQLDTVVTAPASTTEEYSNLGYALLGAALVAATPYEELLHRHVLDPLGVADVAADPPPGRRLCRRGLF